MKTLVAVSLCLVLGFLAFFWRAKENPALTTSKPLPAVAASQAPSAAASRSSARSLATKAKASLELPKPTDVLWEKTPSEPAFARFHEWAERYAKAPANEKTGLEPEGIELARERLHQLADLIQSNPERALQLAAPLEVREDVPESVKALLEDTVNTRADYKVIGVLPLPGTEAELPSVIRSADINGEEYAIFTYGPALDYVTRANAPLNGIAVPASAASKLIAAPLLRPGRIMALNPNPARQLEPREAAPILMKEAICPASGKPTAVAVEIGGEPRAFCEIAHAQEWTSRTVAAAGLTSPSGSPGQLPIAESSYTEGRKRFLLMRPGFIDLTNTLTDANVLSHFLNFSNYMFELSYGKLVFAGLGQGSDYTPIMRLPKVASTFDNNALGSGGLYDTAKAVAQTNYGFNISQYDFLYVVTAGPSPAYTYAGLGFVGGVGFHLANGYFGQGTASHEYGHNLGLNHANYWSTGGNSIIGPGASVEYGDSNDPMGGASGEPEHYNSRYMNYLGWIHDTDVANVTSSGLYRLFCFDTVDLPGGFRGLKFVRNASQNYWVQFRQRYTTKAMANGVQVLWTGNANQSSLLLDIRLSDSASDDALAIGRTLSDTNIGLHITPLRKGNTYPESIDVMMNVGSFVNNHPPVASVSASTTNAGVLANVTFNVAASDPDNDTLAYWWDFGDGDYSVDNQPAATHSFATAGEYLVQCTVSDMKGGVARDSVVVRAGSPSTFRISGRVLDLFSRPLSGILVSADASHQALSDSDGSYTIANLPAGNYALSASEPIANAAPSFAHLFFNPVTVGPSAAYMDFLVGTSAPPTLLVSTGSVWKYLDDGSDQGTAWRASVFDDSAWRSGPAQFGYGENDQATTNSFGPDPNHKYTTYYYRHAFTVDDPSGFTNVVVSLLRDDGGIVYLNGVEIFRSNMPGGPVTYTTFAATTAADDGKTWFLTNVPPSLVAAGTNVIAVEIHQADFTSSDISFDLSLTTDAVTNLTRTTLVYLTGPANGAAYLTPANIQVTANALSTIATVTNVEFFDGSMKFDQVSSPPYNSTLSGAAPGAHALSAVAVLDGGIRATSAPVVVQVTAPELPPISISLIETGSVWKFYTSNAAPSGVWTTNLGYNDSKWFVGAAKLGYGQGDEATVISYGTDAANKWITSYYRYTFMASDPGGMTNLYLQLKRDDGAVVYLNGLEILRDNMPTGTVTYGTLAASDAADNGQVWIPYNIDPARLVPGTNVLAVEIHQSSATTPDSEFDLALTGQAVTNRPPGVWLTAPSEGDTIPLAGTVPLKAEGVVSGVLNLVRMDFYVDGVRVGQDLTPPYSVAWVPTPGPHQLFAVALDSTRTSMTSAPVNVVLAGPPLGETLVSFGDVWKYLDDGSNQGTNWVRPSFDDRMWMAGPSRLGYGNDGELTTISYGPNSASRYITAYFRKAINIPNPSAYDNMLLRLVRDDGAVVYLNGVEVYRNNLLPGQVSWTSLATAVVNPPGETTPLDVLLSPAQFIAGTNVLAVELHQATTNSEDAGFNLALIGQTPTNMTSGGIYLTSPSDSANVISPDSISLSAFAFATGGVALVEYFDGDSLIGQSSVSPYAFTWASPPIGAHVLTARLTDSGNQQIASPPITVNVSIRPAVIVPITETLIPARSTWKFWDNSAAVAAGWQTVGFNDSTWPSGAARFGWGLDGEATTLTSGRITHYFRRWFTVTNPLLLTELTFQLARDDGAVVYLNGAEVFRSNMPTGAITATTLASTTVNTPDESTYFETTIALTGSSLNTSNLVAVELHQGSATSSDAGFDLQLLDYGTSQERVALINPTTNQSFTLPAAVPLNANAWGGYGVSISKVHFYADNSNLVEATDAPYQSTWYDPPLGLHTLFAVVEASNGALATSAPVNITVRYQPASTVLFPSNSVWKYLDDGSDQGTNWAQTGFNDSAWRSGPARLGYGGQGEETTLNYGTDPTQKYITYYFRRWFTVPDTLLITNLSYLLLRDDGAVVWLNGAEIFRSNMPTGAISYLTLASTNVTGSANFLPGTAPATRLVPGTNLLAVEVHQNSAASADMAFDMELDVVGYTLPPPPTLSIENLGGGGVRVAWPLLSASYQLYSTPNLSLSNLWAPVETTFTDTNTFRTVIFGPGEPGRFYRLQKP